jgi:ribosomal protein S18 acetylase RimI-like enzyme
MTGVAVAVSPKKVSTLLVVDRSSERSGAVSRAYRRIPFELAGDAARRHLRGPKSVSWRTVDDDEELARLLARTVAASDDPREIATVGVHGSRAVAAAMIEDVRRGNGYQCHPSWWSIVDLDGVPSGFVLPVVLTGCDREGLDEGTIYHIGVVPEQCGRDLGRLLLGRGTDALLHHGVWQISTDTAVENAPMIRLFEGQGWTRLPPVEMAGHPLPGLRDIP